MTEKEKDLLKRTVREAELSEADLDEVAGGACQSSCEPGCSPSCQPGNSGGTELE